MEAAMDQCGAEYLDQVCVLPEGHYGQVHIGHSLSWLDETLPMPEGWDD